MTTPNNINPNGISDGDGLVVPTESNINPNGGGIDNQNAVKNAGTVHVTGNKVESTTVEYRDDPDSLNQQAVLAANNRVADNAITPSLSDPQVSQRVVVEDSVTHQAGEGITAGMAASQETPDIFDNSPQAAIKTQTANNELVDDREVTVIPETGAVVDPVLQANNAPSSNLETLPDGSVDIHRD